MDFSVIFENKSIIVIDKPSGWLSTPSRFGDDPRPCLGTQLQSQLGQQIFPAHRLDEETTGIIVFAKSPEAHKILNRWFEHHKIRKTYEALSEGDLASAKSIGSNMENRVLRGKKRTYESPVGQFAHTQIAGVSQQGPYLYWILNPSTGRAHQLRFQLASRGFAILGDTLYGATSKINTLNLYLPKSSFPEKTIALRSTQLAFPNEPELERYELPKTLQVRSFLS